MFICQCTSTITNLSTQQAYEDYRVKLLSDLDNISLKSLSSQHDELSAGASPSHYPNTANEHTSATHNTAVEETSTSSKVQSNKETFINIHNEQEADARDAVSTFNSSSVFLPILPAKETETRTFEKKDLSGRTEPSNDHNACSCEREIEGETTVQKPTSSDKREDVSEVSEIEKAIPELTKAIKAINDEGKNSSLSDVLEMISSLKVDTLEL